MPELKKCFEESGFTNVTTVLASGNVVFDSKTSPNAALEKKIETAMSAKLGRTFLTIVRSIDQLAAILESNPFPSKMKPGSKRVITFLKVKPEKTTRLPIEADGVCIHRIKAHEVFTSYVPGAKGPVFMIMLEKTFGKEITTRTWETVEKVVKK